MTTDYFVLISTLPSIYRACLAFHPRGEHVANSVIELHGWLHSGGCVKRGEIPEEVDTETWKVAYDLQPNKPYPER